MIFKDFLIGGFLFAIACVSATPNIATLEVVPNFDQGLTRKDFRVIYPGGQSGSDVTIKIYKESQPDAIHTFKVPETDVGTQKAYYFGLKSATSGKYEVQVCKGASDCSGKTTSLGNILQDNEKGQVKCAKGRKSNGKWKEEPNQDLVIDITEPGEWLTQANIDSIETAMNGGNSDPNSQYTEWRKYGIQSNPSYANNVFYTGVNYDMVKYKDMFMTEEVATAANQPKNDGLYVDEFCERKYLLSAHVHLVDPSSQEVKYRFKKTLYMSPQGKQYFIINNHVGRQVHVEMAFKDTTIASGTYLVWVSLCTTEKDVNDSTMCSDPVVHTTELNV